MKVAVIAIGTEITSGEVINTNAAWISTELEQLGFQATHHMAIPDDRALIKKAFDQMNHETDLIVTTGGLGPTTDDLTAQVIADWLQVDFVFNEQVWKELQQLLRQRTLKILDAHKTQCWFPKGAQLFHNPVGSACGFYSHVGDKKILVLPGPPREIAGMWNESIREFLGHFPKAEKKVLKKWTCLGLPESELAELTEDIFKNSGIELGYRANIPYVQFKVWFDSRAQLEQWKDKVKKIIGPWVVSEDGEDPIKNWTEKLPLGNLQIFDSVSQGLLASRLWEARMADNFTLVTSEEFVRDEAISGKTVFFLKTNATGVEIEAGVWSDSIQKFEVISLPYRLQKNSQRAQKYFVETAFQIWAKLLT